MLSRTLGPGPWLWAAQARLWSATEVDRPVLPWYANVGDQTPVTVAWERERGYRGFYNRHWRKRLRYARRMLQLEPTYGQEST
jgi:hypothetical protein